MKLRILTYNIHKGFDWNNKNYFLNEIMGLITSADPDLIFLQEVSGKNDEYRKSGLLDAQFEYFADSIWSQHAYARNAVYDHGHHGNLILSRYPITSWNNTDLSTNPFEQRGLLICHIEIPQFNNKKIVAACTHLDLFHRGRKKQYQKIKDKILDLTLDKNTPLIIAGDFNDWNKKATVVFEDDLGMTEIFKERNKTFAKTFPASWPVFCLDRVYIKNCKSLDARIWSAQAPVHFSDHLPLLCEVEIAE